MYVKVSDASRTLEVGFEESFDCSSSLRASSDGVCAARDDGAAGEFSDFVESVAGRVIGLFESKLTGNYDARSLGGFAVDTIGGCIGAKPDFPKIRDALRVSDIAVPSVEISAGPLEGSGVGSKVGHDSADDNFECHVLSSSRGEIVNNDGPGMNKTELNRRKRAKHKARKLRRQSASAKVEGTHVDLPIGENRGLLEEVPEWRRRDVDLPKGENHGDGCGRNGKPLKDSVGFWKSCSDDVRQRLIDSKAEMHIAENRRKTLEAMARVDYLSSAQACVDKVVSLAARAKQIAEQEGNAAVLGWAQTVTSSSVESVARSAPSTVPSFDSVSSAINEAERLKAEREKAEEERLLSERMATIVKLTREADEQKEVEKALRETIARLEKERKPVFQRNAGGSAVTASRCHDGSKYYDAEMEAAHKKRADEVANRKKGVVYDRFDALLGVDKGRLLTRAEYLERSR